MGLVDKVHNAPCRTDYIVRLTDTGTRRRISFLTAAQQLRWGLSNLSKPSATFLHSASFGKVRVKVHHISSRERPEGEQMYNSTLSLTSALDGGGGSTPRPGSFTRGKDPVPTAQEAGWAPGPVRKISPPPNRDWIPGLTSPQQVAIPIELSRPIFVLYDIN